MVRCDVATRHTPHDAFSHVARHAILVPYLTCTKKVISRMRQKHTDIIRINPTYPESSLIEHAATLVRAGELVVFPTETVYGLGANALQPEAVERIFAVKGRPFSDPL